MIAQDVSIFKDPDKFMTAFQNTIFPDTYPGTDAQKLQSAFNAASTSNAEILLTRIYDITGSTINIANSSSGMKTYIRLRGISGGIKKTDSGFIFSKSGSMMGRFKVQGVLFISTAGAGTSVFNMDEMYELVCSDNQYINVDHVAYGSGSNQQSPRFINENIQGGTGYAFDFVNLYDCSIDECICEQREAFFIQRSSAPSGGNINPNGNSANIVRITNCLIEGLTGSESVIKLGFGSVVKIDGNYFEGCAGQAYIDISQNASYGFTVSNNIFNDTTTSKYCIWLPTNAIGSSTQSDKYLSMSNEVRGGAGMFYFSSQPAAAINVLSINDICNSGAFVNNYSGQIDIYGTNTATKSTTTGTTNYTYKNGVKRYKIAWHAGIQANTTGNYTIDVGYAISSNAQISVNIQYLSNGTSNLSPSNAVTVTNIMMSGTDNTKLTLSIINGLNAYCQPYLDITIIDY